MNNDRRLLDHGADPFEAALLRSARRDGASATHHRTLAALGLVASGATSALQAGAATGASQAGAAAAGKGLSLSALKTLSTAKLLTWLGLGAAGGAVTLAVVHSRSLPAPPRLTPASGVMVAPLPHLRSRVPASNEPVTIQEPSVLAGPSMLVAPPVARVLPPPDRVRLPVARRTEAPPAAATSEQVAAVVSAPREQVVPVSAPREQVESASPDALLEEVSLLDRARLRLSRRDAAGALQDADAYLARFPGGRLANEATVIRIRAVLLSQGRSAAAPLAESFLRQHPDSPHASSLQQVFSTPSGTPDR
jgi:hypothetical protein